MSSPVCNEMPSPNASPSPNYIQSKNSELLSQANNSLIPKTSEKKYKDWFNKFDAFCISRKLQYTQDSLLMYLEHFAQTEQPAHKSMYTYTSGIKSVLTNNKGIKTKNWHRVKSWLSQYSTGKFTDKAPTFTKEEISLFRKNAPVDKYRRHKIAEGFGTYGRLRAQDYANLYHNKSTKRGQEEKIDIYDSYVIFIVMLYLYTVYKFYI